MHADELTTAVFTVLFKRHLKDACNCHQASLVYVYAFFYWIITRLCLSQLKIPNLIYIFNLIFKMHTPLFFNWVIAINRLIKIEVAVIMLGVWQQQRRDGYSFVPECGLAKHFDNYAIWKKKCDLKKGWGLLLVHQIFKKAYGQQLNYQISSLNFKIQGIMYWVLSHYLCFNKEKIYLF